MLSRDIQLTARDAFAALEVTRLERDEMTRSMLRGADILASLAMLEKRSSNCPPACCFAVALTTPTKSDEGASFASLAVTDTLRHCSEAFKRARPFGAESLASATPLSAFPCIDARVSRASRPSWRSSTTRSVTVIAALVSSLSSHCVHCLDSVRVGVRADALKTNGAE